MKKFSFMTLIAFFSLAVKGQTLTQTVRGTLKDADSQQPLIGATVMIPDSDPLIGGVTGVDGSFKLKSIPLGRITLQLSYLGYTSKTIPNIIVDSGKEVVLDLSLQESVIKMEDLVVRASANKGEAINDMALISARSISPDETKRYPGTFNDPSRIVANFAGVTATQDGSNDIIVRGNSPKYMQWRLEGIQIPNPNHFADQNAAGGSISALNNNMLATSDFYTGAFSPEYGDALSAVYDVKLRNGNNERFESVFGFGLLGTDFTVEGPFKKEYNGSYVANYRYSTVSLISDLGLVDVNGIPKFQDAAFKVFLPSKGAGTFSIFGLGGVSNFVFEDITPDIWQTPGDQSMRSEIHEDYDKVANMGNLGVTHLMPINNNSFISTTIAYSGQRMEDKVYEYGLVEIYDAQNNFLRDSAVNRVLNFKSQLLKSTFRGALTYSNKISASHKIEMGTKYAYFDYDYEQSKLGDDRNARFTSIDFKEHISTVRNFISWKFRPSESITLIAGIHNMNVLYNNKSTIEPRLALNWKLNDTNAIHAGYGNHSTMESVHHYFARVEQANGTIAEPNQDLDLLRAHHYVLGYKKKISNHLSLNLEVYYQDLYNLPVEHSDTSIFSTINEGIDFRYVDLVNEGTGQNYGIEATLERFFHNGYHFMVNGSLFQSKYKALDGIERNTQYSSNYMVNILFGKEFQNLGRKQNQVLSLEGKAFIGGGRKIIPLLRDDQGNLAVEPDSNQFWDYQRAYEHGLEDIYTITLSASYKWNKPKATHELNLTFDNVTNNIGKISEFYDESEPNSIGYLTQFGFFPNLMYRVYF